MAGKGRQTARKPAIKFAHLRKEMEKTRIISKIGKKRTRRLVSMGFGGEENG